MQVNTGIVVMTVITIVFVVGLLYLMWDMHKDKEWLSKKSKE